VFIDEAHVNLLLDSLQDLAHLRQTLEDLHCPLLLLTATASPSWTDALLATVGLHAHRPGSLIRATSTARTNNRYVFEPVPARYHRRPASVVDAKAPLHGAVGDRALVQAASVSRRSGGAAGRLVVLGDFCETVVEVKGIVAQPHARLRRTGQHGSNGSSSSRCIRASFAGVCAADDVVIVTFHSQGEAPDGTAIAKNTDGGAAAVPTGALIDQDRNFNGAFPGPAIRGGSIIRPTPDNLARVRSSIRTGGSIRPPSVFVSAVVADALPEPVVGAVIVVGSQAGSIGIEYSDMVWALFLGPHHPLGLCKASGLLCGDV